MREGNFGFGVYPTVYYAKVGAAFGVADDDVLAEGGDHVSGEFACVRAAFCSTYILCAYANFRTAEGFGNSGDGDGWRANGDVYAFDGV